MSGNPSLSTFFFFSWNMIWYQMTHELNGTGQLGSQKYFFMVTEWAQFLGSRGNSPVLHWIMLTLVFYRYKLSVWGLFENNWTIPHFKLTASNFGWILKIMPVGDLFPVVPGICSVYWGTAQTFPCRYTVNQLRGRPLL